MGDLTEVLPTLGAEQHPNPAQESPTPCFPVPALPTVDGTSTQFPPQASFSQKNTLSPDFPSTFAEQETLPGKPIYVLTKVC